MSLVDVATDPWAHLVGQADARARLESAATAPVHAYLLLGARGSGTFRAATGFAGLLLAHAQDDPADQARAVGLAIDGKHPDVVVFEPEGASIRVAEAEEIIRAGLRTPVEGSRKVIIVTGIETLDVNAVGRLLKMVEEPPPSTVFVLLAEEIPPEIVTIQSRCVTVEFGPLSTQELTDALLAGGTDLERAEMAAAAAGGDLDRAQLLATDDQLAARAEAWREVPDRLDGSGFAVSEQIGRLTAGMDEAQGPLEARQGTELAELEERVEQLGERGSGRSELVARHKRELRKLRSDELRFGFSTLARVYRDRLVAASTGTVDHAEADRCEAALASVQDAAEALIRNPNETLLLQHLLLCLSPVS